MADSCPNYLYILAHMPLAYPLEFGLLTQLGHPFAGDRLNCGLSEYQGTCVVPPKSERQTATLDQR
jgi:hypothetical protein